MNHKFKKLVLAISGILLGGIGGSLVITPQAFLAMSNVIIEPDPGLLSELSAPGGLLVLVSIFMILGSVKENFTDLALSLGAWVYGSYGVSRLVGMASNGVPSESLVAATLIELGVAGMLVALKFRSTDGRSATIRGFTTGN